LQTPWGVDYGKLTPLTIKATQDIVRGLTDITEATTTISTSTDAFGNVISTTTDTFAGKFWTAVREQVKVWLADAQNSIDNLFAKKIYTEEICVGQGNDRTCINKAKLDQILLNQNSNNNPAPTTLPTNTNNTATSTATTTSIGIILLGDNPLTLASTTTEYIEPGATALDDLGAHVDVSNDSAISMGSTTLATPGNYIVTYTATNAGVSTTTIRNIIIN
jgi:hypothetical protein